MAPQQSLTPSYLQALQEEDTQFGKELHSHIKSGVSAYVPAFVIFPNEGSLSGSLLCPYNSGCNIRFNCHKKEDCFGKIIKIFEKLINFGKDIVSTVTSQVHYCPRVIARGSTGMRYDNLADSQDQQIMRILCKRVNFTLGNGASMYGTNPRISFLNAGKFDLKPGKIYLLGYTARLNFITSDHVEGVKTGLSIYYDSFGPILWICLGIIILLVAGFVSLLSKIGKDLLSFEDTLYAIVAPLIGQNLKLEGKKLIVNAVILLWLLITVVINNSYSGMIESDFSVSFPMESKWEHLRDIQNFTFFIPGRCLTMFEFHNLQRTLNRSNEQTCVKLPQEFRYSDNEQIFLRVPYDRSVDRFENNRRLSRFHCICNGTLRNVVVNNLTKPRTALLVVSTDLDVFWGSVAALMYKNLSLRFAHNFHIVDDGMFQSPMYILLEGQVEGKYDVIGRMLGQLTYSGVMTLWKRLKAVSSVFQRQEAVQRMKRSQKKTLANDNAGLYIHTIKLVLSLLYFIALVIFILEHALLCWRCRRRTL
ncbi:unnamed protein product [Allacma fusca]|uniref:Uncharacterized protein n=1 Tax=Allacma fusca TaxID=39272 RepID=A0A8J2P5B8_9HEXA|nr:unnamed protein product [Allacma fusca]